VELKAKAAASKPATKNLGNSAVHAAPQRRR